MEYFTINPMVAIAMIVFFSCVIIGFFGDMRLRKQADIKKFMNEDNKESNEDDNKNENTDDSENQDVKEVVDQEVQLTVNQNMNTDNLSDPSIINNDYNNQTSSFDNVFPQDNIINNQPIINEVNDMVAPVENTSDVLNNPSLEMQNQGVNIVDKNFNASINPAPFDGQINTDDNINNMF